MSAIPPPERVLTFIKSAEQATQQAKEAAVTSAGLTKAQYNALVVLDSAPGLSSAELARRCFVSPQAMKETTARLERDAFITRSPHPLHRNVVELRLTALGQGALKEADVRVVAVETALRDALTATELEQLRDYLAKVQAAAQMTGEEA